MRELQLLLLILLSALALIVSCDTTEPSFDETIPEVYSLSTQVFPVDGGRVEPDLGNFEVNERFDIEAIPFEGYVFERWEGDLTGNTNPESIVIDDDKNITARFTLRDYPLNITVSGQGSVTEVVESRPSDGENSQNVRLKAMNGNLTAKDDSGNFVQTSVGPITQNQSVHPGLQSTSSATVRVKAEPEEGWYFEQWEGDLTGNVNPEVITVDEEKNVTAVFLQEDTEGYSIHLSIIGQGSVNKNPDRTYFNEGDEVTLTANPDQGWHFIEWQGDLAGSENSKTVSIEESLNITALFEETDDPTMMITQQPSGTTAGTAISPAPEIKLTDGLGEPVQGAEVTVSLNEKLFTTESSTTANTDADGIASFDNLIIETALSDYILTFDANEPDISDISSNPFGVIAAAGDPSNSSATVPDGIAGVETVTSIIVKDRYGNVKTDITDEIVVEISGANNVTPTVSKSNTPGEYIVSYTPEKSGTDQISIQLGGEPIDGSPFKSKVVAAGVNPSKTLVSAKPNIVTVGEVSVVTIKLRDRFSNPIGRLAENDFEVSFTGEATVGSVNKTSKTGVFSFEITSTTSGDVSVSVIANGITLNDTPTITFEPGEPDKLVVITQPENTQSGQRIAGPPAVRVRDEFGNSIPGVDVSVSEERGAEFFDGSLTVKTNQSGVATFDDLVLNRLFGSFKLVFSVEGLPEIVSDRFQVAPFNP